MPNKKILIIDVDGPLSSMLSKALEQNKYQAVVSSDGQGAVKLIGKEKPSLILLSVELGEANGYLICKEIKEDKELKTIPLILMSSKATQEDFDKHRKLKVRAEDYLIKPFSDEDLLKKVENLIGFHISEEEYNSLQEKVAQFLEEKTALESKLSEKEEELGSVREKLRSSVKSADLLHEKLEASERRLKDMTSREKKAEERIAEQNDRIHELDSEKKRLEDEKKRLKDLIGRARGILEGEK